MPGTQNRSEIAKLALFFGLEEVNIQNSALLTDEDGLLLLTLINSQRYVVDRTLVPKSKHWGEMAFFNQDYSEGRFRSQFRMSRQAFMVLCDEISGDTEFNEAQDPVPFQICVALYRFGTYGNASGIQHVATKFGISEGTVVNFTNRVIAAINRLSGKWIQWPSQEERKEIGSRLALKCLPKCVGFVDGTDVILSDAPLDSKEVYWSRKKRYCMQLQIICDPDLRIREVFTGYPGSVHDAKVYSASPSAVHPQQFFSEGEFIIGDSAYTLTETVIVPYRRITEGLPANKKAFNCNLSQQRVAVENAIGLLKSRFQSLKGLRIKVSKESGHRRACEWILVCCVLHNMLFEDDPWEQHEDCENDETLPQPYQTTERTNKGKIKREALLAIYTSVHNT